MEAILTLVTHYARVLRLAACVLTGTCRERYDYQGRYVKPADR